MLQFIEGCLGKGESVLVHCLMGAHRAGTTGVICAMHFRGDIRKLNETLATNYYLLSGLNKSEAIQYACSKRSLIDPIGDFPQLLKLCDKLQRDQNKKFLL